MSSLSENKAQEAPNDFLSLMTALKDYDQLEAANEIVEQYEDEEARIIELQKLLELAPGKLEKRLERTESRVVNQVNFTRLRRVSQTLDLLERRAAMIALLEDYGLDYKKISR